LDNAATSWDFWTVKREVSECFKHVHFLKVVDILAGVVVGLNSTESQVGFFEG
jgi:hypothetical protein